MAKTIALLVPTLLGGGAEKIVSELSIYFSKDIKVYLILLEDKVDYCFEGTKISLNTKVSDSPIKKIINIFLRIIKLKHVKKKYKFDSVISFGENVNILNVLTRCKEKVVISQHGVPSVQFRLVGIYGKFYELGLEYIYKYADKIIAVSKGVKNELFENFKLKQENIEVIYNPINVKDIQRLANEEIEDGYKDIFSYPTIISVGRLANEKAQWNLIRAFKKVKEIIHDAKLVIVGRGELELALKKLSTQLGLDKDIYFIGFQSNPFKFIKKSKMFVLTSLGESFSNVICEAMSCETPIISSDCKYGPREILAPDTDFKYRTDKMEFGKYGILVPVCDGVFHSEDKELTKDEVILAESIIYLYKNQEVATEYGKLGFERVMQFNIDSIANKYFQQFG